MSRMPEPAPGTRRGRRGRRTGAMIRIARERISDLFGLAEQESRRGPTALPDRYVQLARRIGMRYNVRLLVEYHELYCRGCSSYWVEGRTVRTRLRAGLRTRTCLRCGRVRRVRVHAPLPPLAPPEGFRGAPAAQEEAVMVGSDDAAELEAEEGEEE